MSFGKWAAFLGMSGATLGVAGIAAFPVIMHKQPGPDCILLRYLNSAGASTTRPYNYVLTCPEGMATGSTWDEVAAEWRKGVFVPHDHERVWRP